MYVNVREMYYRFAASPFASGAALPNPADEEHDVYEALDRLGKYCVWLAEETRGRTAVTHEDDWIALWRELGVSGGDAAEVVAFTLSKMPLE